jgi:hypothetical protein
MSIPQGQNPYPGYPPQAGPPQPGDPSRPMYPSGGGSPYPSAAAPSSYPGGGTGRRASSRTLPIIVGVGVAVGVFGGLMIIRGTGSSSAEAGNGNGAGGEALVLGPPDAGAAEIVATVQVDAAPAAVTPPGPEKRTVTLRFEVSPRDADIEVDGKAVKNGALALELAADERKEVEVVVEAEGYEPWTKKLAVSTTDDEQAVSVELEKIKRTTPVRRPPRPRDDGRKRDRDRRPGGIIDL